MRSSTNKSPKLYYTAPSDEQFEELRQEAIKIWQGYDNQFGYASSKINRIKDINNIADNFMFMVAMFDYPNQCKLARALSPETKKAVDERMKDGGQPDEYNPFK